MLGHIVAQSFPEPLCILEYLRALLIIFFGIKNHSFKVAFEGTKVWKLLSMQLALNCVKSNGHLDYFVVVRESTLVWESEEVCSYLTFTGRMSAVVLF